MPGPDPATAAIRLAVRGCLSECAPGDRVLLACSGGADSLALTMAALAEAHRPEVRLGAVVVDHGLQPGSAAVASSVGDRLRALDLDPVDVIAVQVPRRRTGAGAGVEAAARSARYRALEEVATRVGARLVLLGHTRDDQAEQVVLGLVRGSGARSLSGMPAARGRYRRPLLRITRQQTRSSLQAQSLTWWEDPMNEDPAHTRVRVRRALALLEDDLGPSLAAALARSADQLRADADLLDELADAEQARLGPPPWPASTLAALPTALRGRLWRRVLIEAGSPAGRLGSRHTDACDTLLTHWHGQGPLHLPGQVSVTRTGGRVVVTGPVGLNGGTTSDPHQEPPRGRVIDE